jgi:hypothetical protein
MFSSSRAARDRKIERRGARSIVRKMNSARIINEVQPPSAHIFRHFREAQLERSPNALGSFPNLLIRETPDVFAVLSTAE